MKKLALVAVVLLVVLSSCVRKPMTQEEVARKVYEAFRQQDFDLYRQAMMTQDEMNSLISAFKKSPAYKKLPEESQDLMANKFDQKKLQLDANIEASRQKFLQVSQTAMKDPSIKMDWSKIEYVSFEPGFTDKNELGQTYVDVIEVYFAYTGTVYAASITTLAQVEDGWKIWGTLRRFGKKVI